MWTIINYVSVASVDKFYFYGCLDFGICEYATAYSDFFCREYPTF